jgi:hypothetical protein
MKLIQDNPYRIAGILANASEREVVRQKSKIPGQQELETSRFRTGLSFYGQC